MTGNRDHDASAPPRVLLVGLHPRAVDFTAVPELDEAKLTAGLAAARAELNAAGLAAEWCLIDADWTSAAPTLTAALTAGPLAAVLIGAGIRTIPAHFLLFERIVNLARELAPGAYLCFNTTPATTRDAVLRWLAP